MPIRFKKVHRFDLSNQTVNAVTITAQDAEFNDYLDELINSMIADSRSKTFRFPDDPTSIKTSITQANTNNVTLQDSTTQLVAERLLRIEAEVQARIDRLNQEVQKGILLQAIVDNADGSINYVIIKAEHFDFINEQDKRKATGLPIKKKIYKGFCANVDSQSQFINAIVTDSGGPISYYWWNTFLELIEEHSDEYNTVNAFAELDKKIGKKLKDHKEDYMSIRNATVQYFRSHDEFVMDDYVETILENYAPEDQSFDKTRFINEIKELPGSKDFDSRFNIVREKITARFIKKLDLTAQLTLVVKENINLNHDVKADIIDGNRVITIVTDVGYEYFKKRERNVNEDENG